YGVTPAQWQAAAWVGIKRLEGDPTDRAEPFEHVIEREISRRESQGMFDFDRAAAEDFERSELATEWELKREEARQGHRIRLVEDIPIPFDEVQELIENQARSGEHDPYGDADEYEMRMLAKNPPDHEYPNNVPLKTLLAQVAEYEAHISPEIV